MIIFIVPGLLRKKSFYQPFANKFEQVGYSVEIIDLGSNIKNLEESSNLVRERFDGTKGKFHVITHSYGGIITKYTLQKNLKLLGKVETLVFAAVPHGGSWAALLLSMIPAARDIIPSKSHFKDLKKFYYPDNTVNFISHQELKIWPKKNALLKSHIDKVIKGTNHDSIIHDDEFFKEVLAFIESEKGKIKQVL